MGTMDMINTVFITTMDKIIMLIIMVGRRQGQIKTLSLFPPTLIVENTLQRGQQHIGPSIKLMSMRNRHNKDNNNKRLDPTTMDTEKEMKLVLIINFIMVTPFLLKEFSVK